MRKADILPNDEVMKNNAGSVELVHFEINENSSLVGQTSASARLRDDYSALLVAIQRGAEYIKPDGEVVFRAHDILWLVGDLDKLKKLK